MSVVLICLKYLNICPQSSCIESNVLHSVARSVPTEDGLFACITETFIELQPGSWWLNNVVALSIEWCWDLCKNDNGKLSPHASLLHTNIEDYPSPALKRAKSFRKYFVISILNFVAQSLTFSFATQLAFYCLLLCCVLIISVACASPPLECF